MKSLGRASWPPANISASPTVATVRTRRGARAKRRMTSTSVSKPSSRAVARPAVMASQKFHLGPTISEAVMTAARPPRSPWAKLMMRLARYTSTRPMATSPLSEPRMSPRNRMGRGAG